MNIDGVIPTQAVIVNLVVPSPFLPRQLYFRGESDVWRCQITFKNAPGRIMWTILLMPVRGCDRINAIAEMKEYRGEERREKREHWVSIKLAFPVRQNTNLHGPHDPAPLTGHYQPQAHRSHPPRWQPSPSVSSSAQGPPSPASTSQAQAPSTARA